MRKIVLVLLCILINNSSFSIIKIACIGNSITYGSRMKNRLKNAWPVQLQYLLGGDYEVRNFGVSGTTLLKKGNSPYWNTKEYKEALNYNPDIVFIKLGTNDSKSMNRQFYNEFESDYLDLINSFRNLPGHPRIILFLPVPAFTQPDTISITDEVIKGKIIPMVQNVAYMSGCEVISLYNL